MGLTDGLKEVTAPQVYFTYVYDTKKSSICGPAPFRQSKGKILKKEIAKMKTAKRLITMLFVLVLIFALAAPGFATAGVATASYTQNPLDSAPTVTGTFTVYLTILSNKIGDDYIARYDLPVSMGATGVTDTYFVSDVLAAAQSQYSWLTIYSTTSTVLTGDSSAVTWVVDSDVSTTKQFGPVLSYDYRNGWMFRIDDMYPLLNSADWPSGHTSSDGPLGATIEQAYVTANNRITLYFADTANATKATNCVKIDGYQYLSQYNILLIMVSASSSYYDAGNNNYWEISDYSYLTLSSLNVKVNGAAKTATLYSTGVYMITNVSTISGENTIEVLPQFNSHTNNGVTYGITTYTGAAGNFV